MSRFNIEARKVPSLLTEVYMPALVQGIRNHELTRQLRLLPPRSICKLNELISRHISTEETEKWRIEQDRLLIESAHRAVALNPHSERLLCTPFHKRNNKLYCHYHEEAGHTTEDYRQLKDAIKEKVCEGHLDKYITAWAIPAAAAAIATACRHATVQPSLEQCSRQPSLEQCSRQPPLEQCSRHATVMPPATVTASCY
ncbi:hypothetical protein ACLOJK_006693, partial [Asimina triloba]